MKNQKLLLLYLCVLTIFGCVQQEGLPSQQATAVVPNTSGSVIVLADKTSGQALASEISQYAHDVEQDLGVDVVVEVQDWHDPASIRTLLQQQRSNGLLGAVLVGDIPTTFFYAQLQEPGLSRVPSDFYYMELDTALELDGEYIFERPLATTELLPDIWIGRLRPTQAGEAGITQLRHYFQRNHAYRQGNLQSDPQMLVIDDIDRAAKNTAAFEETANNITRLTQNSGLYSPDKVVVADLPVQAIENDGSLESLLQTPYEFAFLNHHGTPTTQQYGTTMFTGAEIAQMAPKPLFYFIWSCSNGDFMAQDYVAGSYLFAGNGLVVFAPTVPVFGNIESGLPYLYPLSVGATFGEAYLYSNFLSPMSLLGDPTLRLRPKPTSAPSWRITPAHLNFGDVASLDAEIEAMPLGGGNQFEVAIQNVGQSPLHFSSVPSYWHVLHNSSWVSQAQNPISFVVPDQIAPNEEGTLLVSFNPVVPGSYQGFIALYTNDPQQVVMVVAFEGMATGGVGASQYVTEDIAVSNSVCLNQGIVSFADAPSALLVGQPFKLGVRLAPTATVSDIVLQLVLPDSITMEGETIISFDLLQASDFAEREIVLTGNQPGTFVIQGHLRAATENGELVEDCQELFVVIGE